MTENNFGLENYTMEKLDSPDPPSFTDDSNSSDQSLLLTSGRVVKMACTVKLEDFYKTNNWNLRKGERKKIEKFTTFK